MTKSAGKAYVGIEAEGRWRGARTLFINTTDKANHVRSVATYFEMMEQNHCTHLYFGVQQSYLQYDMSQERPDIVIRASERYLVTVEHDLLAAPKVELGVFGPQVRHLFTLRKDTYVEDGIPDAVILALAQEGSELKIDGVLHTCVFSKPQVIDLHYCNDEGIQ